MSQQNPSKTPATIKIAAKDASQRTANGTADPGPGDPEATPSEMPEPVSLPAAPSPSELIVKSSTAASKGSRNIKTINDPVSLPKSRGSSASTVLNRGSNMGEQASTAMRESTSAKALSRSHSSTRSSDHHRSGSGGGASSGRAGSQKLSVKSVHGSGSNKPATEPAGAMKSATGTKSVVEAEGTGSRPTSALLAVKTLDSVRAESASRAMKADGQAAGTTEQDLVEDGEVDEQSPSPAPSAGSTPASTSPATSGGSSTPAADTTPSVSPPSGGVDTAPISAGTEKMGPKTNSQPRSSTPASDSTSDASSVASGSARQAGARKKKRKMTKFRYHKRVTVRTHGKTSPTAVMDKVNKKDHKAGITPSSIGEMDPEELMKRAGIKAGAKTHWRVRLRQTKRTTKDGKTVVQTKVAYRDSEGNKRIKTSLTPNCQKCGERLENCKCDE